MSAYYNEIDPYAAQWLRNLIAAGHLIETPWPKDCRPHHQKTTFYRFPDSDPETLISAYRARFQA
jgi:hypothetical protein